MPSPTQRLTELNLTLPEAPAPVASYIPAVRTGNLVYVSGQIPFRDGALIATGSVPDQVDPQLAYECARQCLLNGLAVIAKTVEGDLDRVERIIRLGVFVACTPDFPDHPKVANGASDLAVEIFGENGRHARAAVGAPSLPLHAPVEVELLAQLR